MLGGFRVARRPSRVVGATSIDERPPIATTAIRAPYAAAALEGIARLVRSTPWAVCAITAAAAALRFAELDDVAGNAFYDAAVRSMGLSWHNFLFAAFDPGAILSVDKPPIDLWLQVASVKLFGWNASALKLPEAIGGTLAVPLLYDAVRRAVGRPAGLAAAITLAILPESVLTSRSDTMDSLMMLLIIAALWLTIRALSSGRRRPAVLAGVALGLAFNVKLFEALIAVPALIVLYLIGARLPWRRKLTDLALAGAAFVGVGLSWAVVVSLAPGRHPFPVGSTDGTVWNVIFVFNGFARTTWAPLPNHPGAPGPLRLVQSSSGHIDALFGCVLLAALAIGGAAVITALVRRRKLRRPAQPKPGPTPQPKLAVAFAAALFVWIAVAVSLFSHIAVLRARYLEAVAPALGAAVGYGAAVLAGLHGSRRDAVRPSVPAVVCALALVSAYTFAFRPQSIALGAVAVAVAATGGALLARADGRLGHAGRWLTAGLIVACAALFPVHESLSLVRSHSSDSTGLATRGVATESALWTYLASRTVGTRYELVIDDPLVLAPLIIHDRRPLLPLTSWGHPVTKLSDVYAAVQSGAVRYAVVGTHTCRSAQDTNPACGPAATWIRANGIDVSAIAGILSGERLYLLLAS